MIRRGKTEGWLRLPTEAFSPWATLNGVEFGHVRTGTAPGKGAALLASHALPCDSHVEDPEPLMVVPRDLILSLERVVEQSKIDGALREVLESLVDFGRTPRGAILTFLLLQISISNPHLPEHIGVHTPFTEYVKTLPSEPLPTFWNASELQLLVGTTLAPAVSQKLKSLRREYDLLCSSAAHTRWFASVKDFIDFDDWLQVDAMYRSRALDFPGIGHCMSPCIDLANHAGGEDTVAIYEVDNGDAVLLLRDGKGVKEGEEITITYGDEKGACEMLFSYGFLEEERQSAETLFLSLTIPDSDHLRSGKMAVADCAPGFKIVDGSGGEVDWQGEFVWLLCVNAEDGLCFKLARTVDASGEEMHAFLKDHQLTGGAAELDGLLRQDDLWDVYRLRAVTVLQSRIYDQLQVLYNSQEAVENEPHGGSAVVRDRPYSQIMQLRQLEFDLLERAYEKFETQKAELVSSTVVQRYLAEMNSEPTEDDFS